MKTTAIIAPIGDWYVIKNSAHMYIIIARSKFAVPA